MSTKVTFLPENKGIPYLLLKTLSKACQTGFVFLFLYTYYEQKQEFQNIKNTDYK